MRHTPNSNFTETQAFAGWAYAVLGLVEVVSLASVLAIPAQITARPWFILFDVLSLAFIVNLLCLRTMVTDTEAVVTFGWLFPLYRRRLPLDEIVSVQADTYVPLAEYGGWGIKGLPSNAALNARGNRGVRLTLRNGKRILIGTQRPDELAAALKPPR